MVFSQYIMNLYKIQEIDTMSKHNVADIYTYFVSGLRVPVSGFTTAEIILRPPGIQ